MFIFSCCSEIVRLYLNLKAIFLLNNIFKDNKSACQTLCKRIVHPQKKCHHWLTVILISVVFSAHTLKINGFQCCFEYNLEESQTYCFEWMNYPFKTVAVPGMKRLKILLFCEWIRYKHLQECWCVSSPIIKHCRFLEHTGPLETARSRHFVLICSYSSQTAGQYNRKKSE